MLGPNIRASSSSNHPVITPLITTPCIYVFRAKSRECCMVVPTHPAASIFRGRFILLSCTGNALAPTFQKRKEHLRSECRRPTIFFLGHQRQFHCIPKSRSCREQGVKVKTSQRRVVSAAPNWKTRESLVALLALLDGIPPNQRT